MTTNEIITIDETKYGYMHDSASSFQPFKKKCIADARNHKNADNLRKLIKEQKVGPGFTQEMRDIANEDFFYIMIKRIGLDSLITTISERFDEKGIEAMKYIEGCWTPGANDHKLEEADEQYKALATAELDIYTTQVQFREHCNKMAAIVRMLKGSSREIPVARASIDLIDLVKRMSRDHKTEVRETDVMTKLDDTPQVATTLTCS